MTQEQAIEIIKKNMPSDKSLPVYEALQTLIPELAESEDERIRKGIIEIIKAVSGPDCDVYLDEKKQEKYLAWLEKQKEQKPSLCDECKKKSTCLDTKYGDDRVVEQCINFVKMPQKPAEWSDTKELVFKDICNHLEVEGYSGWVLLLNALHNGEFQPKLAWSKEDEKIIDTIVSVLGQYIDYKAVSCTGSGYATPRYSKEIDWLNSLSLNLKKKNEDVAKLCSNEWSEEDEDTINLIIAILRENHPNGQFKTNPANTTCMSTISTDMLIKRIESLRPSWKPSE